MADALDQLLNGRPGRPLLSLRSQRLRPGATRRLAATVSGTIDFTNSVTVSITTAGDDADLTFAGTAGHRVSLAITNAFSGGLSPSTSVAIRKPDGSVIASSTADYGKFINPQTLSADGTYSVTVSPNGSTGSITLRLYDVPADDSGSIVLGGSSTSVTIGTPGQNGARTFTGSSGQRVSIAITNSSSGGVDSLTDVTLQKPDGSALTVVQAHFGNFIDVQTLPVSGTYTVFVDPPGASIGSITLQAYDVPADDTGTITVGGAASSVTIGTPGQNGARTFSGTTGQRVSLAVTNSSSGGLDSFTTLSIRKPDGGTLTSVDAHFGNFIDTQTLPTSGTYTVFVDPPGASTGSITLQAYNVPADDTATMTIGGASSSVTIGTPGQNASRTFAGQQNQPVTLAITNSSSGGLDSFTTVAIRKPDGSTLASVEAHFGNAIDTTLPTDGTYTIAIDPPGGSTGTLSLGLNQHGSFVPLPQTYGCGDSAFFGPDRSPCLADPVDTLSGSFNEQLTDVALPGIGYAFGFSRSYSSADLSSGRMGIGWHDSLSASLEVLGNGDVRLHGENGQQIAYTRNGDGSFSAATATATLRSVQGGYELVRQNQVHYLFDTNGRLLSIKDRNGKGLTLGYTGSQLTSATDAAGRQITISYGTDGFISGVTLPDGHAVAYAYTSGMLTSFTDLRGKVWAYAYDSAGRLLSVLDPNSHYPVRNTYDSQSGRVSQQLDPLGNASTFAWNASTQTATMTDAAGKQWQDVYAGNELVKRIDPLGHFYAYGYDNAGNLTSKTDPLGNVTSMTYDSAGNMLTRTSATPFSYHESWTYNSFNEVTSYTDRAGNVTSYGYDSAGNLTSTTRPGSLVTAYTLHSGNPDLLDSITDARSKTTAFAYDTNGYLTSATDPLGHVTSFGYDSLGHQTTVTTPRGNLSGATPADNTTTTSYDALGHKLTVTDPLGHTTSYAYDNVGNLASVTNAANKTWTYAYDAANEQTSVTAPDTSVSSTEYNSRGLVSKTISPLGAHAPTPTTMPAV